MGLKLRLTFWILTLIGWAHAQCTGQSVSLGPDQYICTSTNITLSPTLAPSGLSPIGYQWIQNGSTIATTPTYLATSADTFIIQIDLGNSCVVSDTIIIGLATLSAGSIGPDQIICNNGDPNLLTSISAATLTPSGLGSITYQWQQSSSSAGPWTNIAGATGLTYNPGPSSQTTFYQRIANVSSGNGLCSSASNVVSVVNYTGSVSLSAPQCLAPGSSTSLVAQLVPTPSGSISYSWTGPNAYSSTLQNPSISNFSLSNQGSYSVSAILNNSINGNGGNCSFSANTTLTLNPTLPSITLPTTGCPQTTILGGISNVETGVSYNWNVNPAPGVLISGVNTSSPTFEFTNGGIYTVSSTAVNGACQSNISQTIEILGLTLEAPYVSISSAYFTQDTINGVVTYPICSGISSPNITIENTSFFNATNPPGTTYTIQQIGAASQPILDSLDTQVYFGSNYFILTATSGTCTLVDTIDIYSGSNPYVSLGAANTTGLCMGDSVLFVIDPTVSPGIFNPPGTTYTLTISDDAGFSQVFNDLTLDEYVNYIFDSTSCGNSNPGTNFPNNTFYAQVVAENACGQTVSSVSPITVSNDPIAQFVVTDSTLCEGQSITVTNQGSSGQIIGSSSPYNCTTQGKFYWTITGGIAGIDYNLTSGTLGSNNTNYTGPQANSGIGSNSLAITFNNAGYYTITQIYHNSCERDTFIRNICVIEPPICNFTASPSPACSPSVVSTLNTSTIPTCDGSPINVAYNWAVSNPATGTSSTISSQGATQPNFTLLNNTNTIQNFVLTLTVTPMEYNVTSPWSTPNCSSTCTQTVSVYPAVVITTPTSLNACHNLALSIPLSANVPASFTWYANQNPNVSGETTSPQNSTSITDLLINNSTTSQTVTYTVIASSTIGSCPDTIQFTLTLLPPITIGALPNLSLCAGNTQGAISFTSNLNPATFAWTNTNAAIGLAAGGTGNIAAFVANNTGSVPILGQISVTPTVGICQGTPTSFTITVNPIASIANVPNQVFCAGDQSSIVNFSSTITGSTIQWTNSNTAIGLAANGTGNLPSFTTTNSGASTISATISVQALLNNCPGPIQTFSITVNPLPIIVAINDQTLCAGQQTSQIVPTSSVVNTTFSWTSSNTTIGLLAAFGSGSISPFTTLNNSNVIASTTLTFTPISNGCTGPQELVVISVNPLPNVLANNDTILCSGTTTNTILFASNPIVSNTTYNWINSQPSIGLPSSGSGAISSFTAVNGSTANIIASITVTPIANGCSGTPDAFTIIVVPGPVLNPISNQVICAGTASTSVMFTGSPASNTYTWTNNNAAIGLSSNGTGNISAFTTINTSNTPAIASITVTPNSLGCPGISQTFTITVNPIPQLAGAPDLNFCHGQTSAAMSFVLSNNVANTSFSWISSNTSIGLVSGTGILIPSFVATNLSQISQTSTVILTPIANACQGLTDTFNISVTPLPSINIIPDLTYCSNQSTGVIAITAPNPLTTLAWSSNNSNLGLTSTNGTGSISSFTTSNQSLVLDSITITVTPTLNGCIGATQAFEIFVLPISQVNSPPNLTVCHNTPVLAQVLSLQPLSANLSWSFSNANMGLSTTTGSGLIVPGFTANNTSQSVVTGTMSLIPSYSYNNLTCNGNIQNYTISINPIPQIGTLTPLSVFCEYAQVNVNFTSNIGTGMTYNWTNDNSLIGIGSSGSSNSGLSFAAVNDTNQPLTSNFIVTPVFTNNNVQCLGASVPFAITINPMPDVNPLPDYTLCATETGSNQFTSINPIIGLGTTYIWTNSNTAIGLIAGGTGSHFFTSTNSSTSPITGTVSVTPYYTNNGVTCIGSPTSFVITVNPMPTVDSIPDQAFCSGISSAAVVPTGNIPGTSYTWTNDNTSIGIPSTGSSTIPSATIVNANSSPIIANFSVTPSYTYNNHLCVGTSEEFAIIVNPIPQLSPVPDTSICAGNTLTLNFASNPGIPGISYSWQNSNSSIGLPSTGSGPINFTALNSTFVDLGATIIVNPNFNFAGANCLGTADTFLITVHPSPTMAAIQNQTICAGANFDTLIFVSNVANTTFNWLNTNPSIGLAASGIGNILPFTGLNTTNLTASSTIQVSPVATFGGTTCQGLPQSAIFTVNPIPILDPNADTILCHGSTFNLIPSANIFSGMSYLWTNTNANIGLASAGSGAISFTTSNTTASVSSAQITYTPTYTNNLVSCVGASQTMLLEVVPLPQIVATADVTSCNGQLVSAINFTSNISAVTYTWLNSNMSIGLSNGSGVGSVPGFTGSNTSNTSVATSTISVTPNYTYANVACLGPSDNFLIAILPTPTLNAPPNSSYCSGQNTAAIPFSGTGTNYTWTNNNTSVGLPISGSGASIPSFQTSNTGISNLTASIEIIPEFTQGSTSCFGLPTITSIVVLPIPTVVNPGNYTYCNGETSTLINLTGTISGTTYNWSNNLSTIGIGASGQGNILPAVLQNSGNNPVTANFTVTPLVVNGNTSCLGNPISFDITVNPSPLVQFSLSAQTICSGQSSASVVLNTPTAAATISWIASSVPASISGLTPSSGAASNPNTIPSFTLSNSSNQAQTIQFVANASTTGQATCLGGGSTYTITVNPLPTMADPPDQTICHNQTTNPVQFTSTFATSYEWQNTNSTVGLSSSGSGNISSFTALNSSNSQVSTTTITVTPFYSNNNVSCPGTPQSFQFTVNPIPIVNPGATLTFCTNDLTPTINPQGTATTYTWTQTNPSVGLTSTTGSGAINPFTTQNSTSLPLSSTISWTPIYTFNSVSCIGLPSAQQIVVNPIPTVLPISDQTICHNNATVPIAFLGTASSYQWLNTNATTGIPISGSGNIPSLFVQNGSTSNPNISTITATAIYTNNNLSCPGNTVNFSINVLPQTILNPLSNQTLCNGDTSSLVVFTGTGTSYSWSNLQTSIGLGANGVGSIPSFVAQNTGAAILSASVVVTPIFTLNSISCPGTPENITFAINPTPGLTTPLHQVLCANNQTNAVIFSGNATSYNWTNTNTSIGLPANGQGNIGVFIGANTGLTPQVATITIEPIFTGGSTACPGTTTSFTITVNPIPIIDTVANQALCANSNTQPVLFTGQPNGVFYEWTNSNSFIGLASSGTGNILSFAAQNPSSSVNQIAQFTVTPALTNANLTCYGSPELFTITVHPTPIVTPPANLTYCAGTTVPSLSFSGTANQYIWTNSNPGIGLPSAGQGDLNSFIALNQSIATVNATITITPYFNQGLNSCQGLSQSFQMAILPIPSVVASSNQLICNGALTDTITFSGPVVGAQYQWSNSLPNIGLSSSGVGNILPFTALNNTNSQTVAQITALPVYMQNNVSCNGTIDTLLIQINPTPVVNNPGPQVYCAQDSSNLLIFNGTATNYSWSANQTLIGNPLSGQNSIPVFETMNTGTLTLSTTFSITPFYTTGNLSCPGPIISVPFYVNPIPVTDTILPMIYCHQEQASVVTISGSATQYQWYNTNTNIGLGPQGLNQLPSFFAQNTSLITDTAEIKLIPLFSNYNLTCVGDTTTAFILVHPLPHITYIPDTILCNYGSLNVLIDSDINANYIWSASNNAQVNGELNTPQTNNLIQDSISNLSSLPQFVTYTISPTAFPTGCAGPDSSFVVQIQPNVTLSIPTNIEICSGLPVNAILNANVPSNFSWFVTLDNPNVTGESITTSINPIINDVLVNNSAFNQIVVYAVFPTSIEGSCNGIAQTITVTVKPPLDLLSADTIAICSGTAVNLDLVANTNVSFVWYADQNVTVTGESLSNVSGSTITDVLTNSGTSVEQVNYHVVGTSTSNGCSSPIFDVVVYVNPIPIIAAIPDTAYCVGQIAAPFTVLGSVNGAIYNWSTNNISIGIPQQAGTANIPGFIAQNGTSTPLIATIAITTSFSFYNTTCIGNPTDFQIVVNPAATLYNIPDLSICNGSSTSQINVAGSIPNAIYSWTNSNPAIGLPIIGNGDIPIFVATNNTLLPIQGTVNLLATYTGSGITCPGQSLDFTIQVNPTPQVVVNDIEICSGDFTNLALNATVLSSFSWTATPTLNVYGETASPIQTSSLINDQLIQNTQLAQQVQYQITPISVPYACVGPVTSAIVTVNPLPIVNFTTASTVLCDLAPVQFVNNSVGILDFLWTFGDGDSSILNNPLHTYALAGSYQVQLLGLDPLTGCSNLFELPLTISQSPDASFVLSDSIGCGYLDVNFIASTANLSWDYLWDFGNGVTTTQVGSTGYQFATPGCYDISLTVTNQQQCSSSVLLTSAVCIFEEAIADFSVSDLVLSSLEPIVQFYNLSMNASSYAWDFGDGTTSLAVNPTHVYSFEPASYLIVLTAFNEIGCIDTATLTITVWEDFALYVPNTFTPNDDEKNQVFLPIISGGYKRDSYHLMIFDRWGELVFESMDPNVGWDGFFGFHHQVCQDGTYTWKISLEVLQSQEVQTFVGHVNLLR